MTKGVIVRSIWIVTYYDMGDDPVVTAFDNKLAAIKCYEFFLGEHDKVNIDEVPIYKSFINKGKFSSENSN